MTRRTVLLLALSACLTPPPVEREVLQRRRPNPLPMRFDVGAFDIGVFG